MSSYSQSGAAGRFSLDALLRTLKGEYRRQGLTIEQCAAALSVSPATIKRWLRGQGLTLDRLQDLCGIAGLDLRDLIEATDRAVADRLTLAQERVLAADRVFAFLFFVILNGWQIEDFQADFRLPEDRLASYLARLIRHRLVAQMTDGRLKPLVSRGVTWRRNGPLIRAFDKQVKHLIMDVDLTEPDVFHIADTARMSAHGRKAIFAMFDDIRQRWFTLAEEERRNPPAGMEWTSLMMMVRPLDMAAVAKDG